MAETANEPRLYRIDEVMHLAGFKTKQTVYNWMRDGIFPRQFKWGQRAVRWPANEVQAVMDARKAGKSNDEVRELVRQLHEKRAAGSAAVGAV